MLLEWLNIHPNIADTVNSFFIYQANKHQIWTKITKHQTQGKSQQLLFSTLTSLNQWIYQSCENGFHFAGQIHSQHLEAEFYLFLPCGYAIKLKQLSFLIFLSASFVRLALCCPLVADMLAFCKVSDRLSVWEKILWLNFNPKKKSNFFICVWHPIILPRTSDSSLVSRQSLHSFNNAS